MHACEHACDVPERKYVPGTRAVMIEFCLQFHAFVRRSKAIGCLVANWQWMSKGLARNAKQQNDRAKAEDETSQKKNPISTPISGVFTEKQGSCTNLPITKHRR